MTSGRQMVSGSEETLDHGIIGIVHHCNLGGAILDPEDRIDDVLDDNDFVSIVLETDRPNPNLAEAEVRFVPSQIPGGKFEIPDVYMSLDGCSLSIDDLGNSLQCSSNT